MTGRENKLNKLSNNYGELDNQGRETLLKIGEKVFTVNRFVDREVSSLVSNLASKNKEKKFKDESF
ncbi:MAG: hypothetical protein LBB77_08280 [Treponema sp.]|jgi:hypothetical protein|nr:hypothetical protein [Treponema sp.]